MEPIRADSVENYRVLVQDMSAKNSADYMNPDSKEHLRIVIAELFRKATDQVFVLYKEFDESIFCASDVFREINAFVNVRKGRLLFIVQQVNDSQDKLRTLLGRDDEEQDHHLKLYSYQGDASDVSVNFVCADRQSFAIQSTDNGASFASFNRQDAAGKITDVFNRFLKKSRELVLAD